MQLSRSCKSLNISPRWSLWLKSACLVHWQSQIVFFYFLMYLCQIPQLLCAGGESRPLRLGLFCYNHEHILHWHSTRQIAALIHETQLQGESGSGVARNLWHRCVAQTLEGSEVGCTRWTISAKHRLVFTVRDACQNPWFKTYIQTRCTQNWHVHFRKYALLHAHPTQKMITESQLVPRWWE